MGSHHSLHVPSEKCTVHQEVDDGEVSYEYVNLTT